MRQWPGWTQAWFPGIFPHSAGLQLCFTRLNYYFFFFFPSTFQDEIKRHSRAPGPGEWDTWRVQPTPCASPTSSFLSLLGKVTGHADCLTVACAAYAMCQPNLQPPLPPGQGQRACRLSYRFIPWGPLPAPLHRESVTHRALPGTWTYISVDDSFEAPLMPEQVN